MTQKIDQKKVAELVKKIQDDDKEISWEKGQPKFKSKTKKKTGKVARAQGAQFELRVRKDLEEKKWILDKWSNNIDLEENKLGPAKRVYNPFKKALVIGTGFPDFVAIQYLSNKTYRVIGVEVKMNGLLSKIEKEKCKWYLKNKIFSEIWIAKKEKEKNRIKIIYIDFQEKYGL
ncbi:MAG: hypothetical protein U9Q99_00285 [Nanoarchaeota archaeon]|nr:hypothetical protein [Nanoarchaeota archaeon]